MTRLLDMLVVAIMILFVLVNTAACATWVVDDSGSADFTSIQAAVDAANAGDTIEVRSGTYYENVNVNKQLTLIGKGASVVTVQAADAEDHVFEVTVDGVNISGFTVTGATYRHGICLINANRCSISGNIASNNNNGIGLVHSSENMLQSNIANLNNYEGIGLYTSSDNTLQNNIANSNNQSGIRLYNSNKNDLIGNIASGNGVGSIGIFLSNSNNNTLTNNNASNNGYGINLLFSSNSMLQNNTANSNNYYLSTYGKTGIGICLYGTNSSTLTNNNASNNDYGIILHYSSDYNTIYHNNFIDNTNYNARDYTGTNQWNSGSEGNYYSDYTGTDPDGDGIGNTPYPIPGGSSEDRYPLMSPYTPHTGPLDRTLLQLEGHSEVYWLQNNKLYWVTDWDVINNMAGVPGWESVNTLPASEFDPGAYTQGPRFITIGAESDGLLIREQGHIEVYLIQGGEKHHFTSPEALLWNGYSFDDVINVSAVITGMFSSGSDISITQAIIDKYYDQGGERTFGLSLGTGEELGDPDSLGVICSYVNFQNGAIECFTNGDLEGNAYAIVNPFFDKWADMGYGKSVLGYPVSDMSEVEYSNFDTPFQYQNFINGTERGALEYNHTSGDVFQIHGAIFAKWSSIGYANSVLGLVTSDEREAVPSFKATTGRVSDFENGHLHWHGSGDHYIITYMTYGDLDNLYTFMGGTASWLGFPVRDQKEIDGYGYCEFEGGYIEWDEIEGVYKAFEKISIKSKLFIEDAPPGVVVNKAHGDKTDVIIEIENTGDTAQNVKVELDCSVLFENGVTPEIYSRNDYFGPENIQNPLNVEIEPYSKKQIIWRFKIPLFPLKKIVFAGKTFVSDKLVSVDGGLINVVQDSTGIIVTNRKLLYEKFGKNAETTSLLNTLYDISDEDINKKEICNVVYYVDRYSSLAADWDQKITYPWIPSESINEVARDIDLIVEHKQKILQSRYLTIVGGDEIIPFYRLYNPDILRWEDDTDSKDPVLEIVNHNYIPTDNYYSDLGGEGLDDWIIPELSIGRISSASAKDMQTFIKNGLKGPSDNNNKAILATDSSSYNVGIIEKILSDKQLDFKPPISDDDSSEVVLQLRNEMNKHKGYKILSYAGHSNYTRIGCSGSYYLVASHFNSYVKEISENRPLFTFGGCRVGLVTDGDDTKWEPEWTDNFVWSLSHNGASAILASGSYCRSQNYRYAYATKVYNDFYKYLYKKESETTNPIGEALKEAEKNYYVDEVWNPFNAGVHKKARVQFILYGIPWMTFDPPINPPKPINEDYNVTFIAPEKLDDDVYRRLITIEVIDYNLTSIEGFDLITIEGASYILSDFKPILPKINIDLHLPIRSGIENISIVSENEIGLGNLNVPNFQSTITNDPYPLQILWKTKFFYF